MHNSRDRDDHAETALAVEASRPLEWNSDTYSFKCWVKTYALAVYILVAFNRVFY